MKKIPVLLLVVLAFAAGIWISNLQLLPRFEKHTQEEVTMLMEKIDQVAKLVTVEGHISEVYDYKDYYGYDWSLFRKKALIRVKAKVSAGYDLENLNIDADPSRKIITIEQLPSAEILSIDHDLDYYDLQEGTFNSFSREDLNQLHKQVKAYVAKIAADSDMMIQAQERGQEMLEMIRYLVEGSGWTFNVVPSKEILLPG